MMYDIYGPGVELSPESVFEEYMRIAKCDYLFTRFRFAGDFYEKEDYLCTLLSLNGNEMAFFES